MTNISLGSGKAVHLAHVSTVTGETMNFPECGGNRASERYRKTTREVTCKNCLKWLAAEAEKAERTAYYAGLAEQQDNFGSQAEPVAEIVAQQPDAETEAPELDKVTGWLVVTDRDGARYIVGPRIQGPFGGMDHVLYRREAVAGNQRRAYPDAMQGTLQRFLWDARARYDLNRQADREIEQRAARMQVTNPPLTASPKPSRDAEAEQLDTAREALLRQLAGIDARLAELRPAQVTEVRVVMDSDSVGTAWVDGAEYAVYRGQHGWGVLGFGIRSSELDGCLTTLARRLGATGTVNVTVVAPE